MGCLQFEGPGDGVTVTLSGTFEEPSNFGFHLIDVPFIESASQALAQWHTISYTSIPSQGIEDNISFDSFVDELNEFDFPYYSSQFFDEEPYGDYITDWNFKISLFSNDNEEYTYVYLDQSCCSDYASWQFIAPELPSEIAFNRNENGQIYGIATVTAVDNTLYTHVVSHELSINKEPDPPVLYTLPGENNTVNVFINNSGGVQNKIFYDLNSGEPYTGTGLLQGNSPINMGSSTNIELEGFIECSKYYFAATATNQYGTSDFSNERELRLFSYLNGLPIYYHFNDCFVSQGYDLEDNHYFSGNLVIESGANLTINGGILFFEEDSKIIIEPGGKLILNGTTCTAPCDQTWAGIEVWGMPGIHQYEVNGECAQGILELKGGAIIENAVTGVMLGEKIGDNYYQTGGILVTNYDDEQFAALFINNQRSINIGDYHNYLPNDPNEREVSNLSIIENCMFEINEDYLMGAWWHTHIYLYQVNGIRIKGNTFVNNYTLTPSGHGINAYQAGFKVEGICTSVIDPCPEQSLIPNTFINFKKAVNLYNAYPYTLTVKNAEFYNNTNGILLTNANNASILFNVFHIGENPGEGEEGCEGDDPSYGIDMINCTNFAVEENEFYKASGAPAGNYIGIRVNSCPSRSDLIYKNLFEGISIGNQAEGWNRSGNAETGVSYFCNENSGNNYDFYVSNEAVIRGYIGYYNEPSGNKLSSTAQVQFQNDYTEPIIYFFNQNVSNEVLTTPSQHVFPIGINDNNTCPSHYGGQGGTEGSIVLTDEEILGKEADYFQNYTDYNSIETLYTSLLDGGNTEVLKTEVETSWPEEMWELRAELLGNSPHLSKEVLMTAADKTDVLPESVLFEILSANPDELRKEELISYLENKEQPLPQYMIEILTQLANGVSYKTVLLSEMESYQAKKIAAAQDIVRSIMNEDEPDFVELRNWLDNIGGIESDKQIISTFIAERDYTSAQNLLNMLPSLYELSGDELNEYYDYKVIQELLINLDQQNRTVFNLTANELANITDIAENGSGGSRSFALGILQFAYDYEYCNCPDLPENIQLKDSKVDKDMLAKAMGLEITANPVPAKEWTAIDYQLPYSVEKGIIEISDNFGKIMQRIDVTDQKGQFVLDTRNYQSGIYYYTIKSGEMQRTGKLIVQ